jgi:hypothetical protein
MMTLKQELEIVHRQAFLGRALDEYEMRSFEKKEVKKPLVPWNDFHTVSASDLTQ